MTSATPTDHDRQSPSGRSGEGLPTHFVPAEVEGPLYESWVERGYFIANPASGKPSYTIVIPPPNVTGSLHVGHALGHTLMDALTRRKRMQGFETLWLPGTDHASIAVQTLVEKHLMETENKTRFDYTRDEFVEKVWDWTNTYGGKILSQMRRLGDGVDWSRLRFTLDDGLSAAVQTIFKRLYDDGLIYRAERIINWCPVNLTALSDAEVDYHEDEGELVSIRYGGTSSRGLDGDGTDSDGTDGDGSDSIVVATTRAETMLGDTAIAVHPDDDRYRHLIGCLIDLPLTGRQIPVIADAHVDPEFGTGAVKVTPAHDPNDFAIGLRHDLPLITMMDESGVVNIDGPFHGMDRFTARREVVEALRAEGRIVAEKRPYLHSVGHCSRCHAVIEPRVSLQWWVKVESMAKAAGDAVRDGRTVIEPASLQSRYLDWTDNMHDWCISRQLWWGHRIPVWYSPDGDEQICLGPGQSAPEGWTQDADALDTWFSSALWPFSTLGWPEKTDDLERFYPTDVLLTGYDIIFFWVVRMMMFGLYAMGDDPDRDPSEAVPFKTVVLTGLVRDQYGSKMSKSKGNVVDPLDWIDTYGADAVRFTMARGSNPGTDVPIGEDWVQASRNFTTKLWNATRFALMNGATVVGQLPTDVSGADAWILSRLNSVIVEVDSLYESYEFAKVADTLYHFAWDEVCDWYLELAKLSLTTDVAPTTRRVLGEVLDVLLRLLHPFIPFVTEALWTELTGGESLVVASWPLTDPARTNSAAEAEIATVRAVVTEVRRFRSDQGLKPSQRVPARIAGAGHGEAAIRSLLRLTEPEDSFTPTAKLTTAAGIGVELDLSSTIDVGAERSRLGKDLAAAQKELATNMAKLANVEFTSKAPEQVIAKVTARVDAANADISRITAALDALPSA